MPFKLRNISFFKDLSKEELEAVKACLKEKSFEKGEILSHEGRFCEQIFVVVSGRIKMYRMSSAGREQILEILGPGDTCACNPGAVHWHCGATAEAMTASRVLFLYRDDYIRMMDTNLNLNHTLNRIFAERLKSLSCLIEEVSLKDAKKRLIKFILDMDLHHEGKGDRSILTIPFTREEIAHRIGTARETVARHLYQLKKNGLIDIKPKQIIILNRNGLEKYLQ